jgi:hypothetical protein
VTIAAVMIDQQVAGDRQQPGALRRAARIKTTVGPQSALERGLSEVLDGLPVERAVGQEAVDPPYVVVIETREVSLCMVFLDVLPLSPWPTFETHTVLAEREGSPLSAATRGSFSASSVIGHI